MRPCGFAEKCPPVKFRRCRWRGSRARVACATPRTGVLLPVPAIWTERLILTGHVEPPSLRLTNQLVSEEFIMDDRIVVDSKICSGKPTIRGTRIMVKNILGMVAGGYTMARIIDAYPELTTHDVTAALEYASQVIDEEKVIPRA